MNRKHILFQQRGFTLTELMIAVVILGILAAFLTPSVARYIHRNKGVSAANAVAGELRAARNHAMSTGQVVFVDLGFQSEHGSFTMYQRQPNNCDAPNPPATCFSQSCAEASGLLAADTTDQKIPTPRADFKKNHPDMKLAGHNSVGTATTSNGTLKLCFAPDGRVLDPQGNPFRADCGGVNARIFVQAIDPGGYDNPLGGAKLDACVQVDARGGSQDIRQPQKDGRDVANFFDIQIPYNGAISVVQ